MAIRAISFYCRGLTTLRMAGCSQVLLFPLLWPVDILCDKFSNSCALPQMTDVAVQYLTIGSLYLRVLDVSGCVLLTDNSATYLERLCPPLCSITMACCSNISK